MSAITKNDVVELSRVDDNIVVITKVKEKKELTMDDIFKDYDGAYEMPGCCQ